ncbi:MAG: hypothetical protein ACRD3M_04575 [Thermoanaerobaculia bacterium]
MTGSPALKSPAELVGRIGVPSDASLLLIDAPEALVSLLAGTRAPGLPLEAVTGRGLRAIKGEFDAVLLWREDRVGSESLLAAAARRLSPSGAIWVVTAMRKVTGPRTPAMHRLDRRDLEKAFSKEGLRLEREARFSAWHVGYRFARG